MLVGLYKVREARLYNGVRTDLWMSAILSFGPSATGRWLGRIWLLGFAFRA